MRKSIFLAIVSLSLTSCATIFTGTKDDLQFNTVPEGAKVMVGGLEKCTTPCNLSMKRSISDQSVTLKLDGYKERTIELDRKFNAVTLVNIIGGGVVGLGVDALTGSMMKYDQKGYEVNLEKE